MRISGSNSCLLRENLLEGVSLGRRGRWRVREGGMGGMGGGGGGVGGGSGGRGGKRGGT